MKATGIVRRIDDLGRVVIPKEIRRTMHMREGDPLEIFTAADGEVVFKKYSPIGEFSSFATQYAEVLSKTTGMTVMITDRDRVVSVCGAQKKALTDGRVSPELEALMDERGSFTAKSEVGIKPIMNSELEASIAYTIIGSGDVAGSVVMMFDEQRTPPDATKEKLVSVAASFLGKQTED